jgi:acetylglutamate kinase
MEEKIEIFIEILKNLKEFFNKIIVVKFGGSVYSLDNTIFQDVVLLKSLGINPVLIHGGGKDISEVLEKRGKKPIFVNGIRYTDKETLKIVKSVLLKINSQIVKYIKNLGGKAKGFGSNKNLIFSEKIKEEFGYVGKVKEIKKREILKFMNEGYIPVFAPLGWDRKGNIYNINADLMAASIAYSLKAEKLLFLTDVEGIYENFPDKNSLISELTISSAEKLLKEGKIEKGMIPKLNSCISALKSGVKTSHIISGKSPHSLIKELLSEKTTGTIIYGNNK